MTYCGARVRHRIGYCRAHGSGSNGRCRHHGGASRPWFGPRPQWRMANVGRLQRQAMRRYSGMPAPWGRRKAYRPSDIERGRIVAEKLRELVPAVTEESRALASTGGLGDKIALGASVAVDRFLEVLTRPIAWDGDSNRFHDVKSARLIVDTGSVLLKLYADLAKAELTSRGDRELIAFLERLNALRDGTSSKE